jgi:hypothetical protein
VRELLRVDTGARASLYVSAPRRLLDDGAARPLLQYLDARRLELICSPTDDATDVERSISSCCGLLVILPNSLMRDERSERDLRVASSLGLASFICRVSASGPSGATSPAVLEFDAVNGRFRDNEHACFELFLDQIMNREQRDRPFAFLAVRIHPDFRLVREAIGDAVENILGIPCVWFDDPRVIAPECGVRERTRLMIRSCSLFIADLTFSPNNPNHDSPNTAHEIGMALAYERPVVLTCQEPRRDLYFCAGDLHTLFWRDEQQLRSEMTACFRSRYSKFGRRLLNLELEPNAEGFSGIFPRYRFEMDWPQRYRAPSLYTARGSRFHAIPDAGACLLAIRQDAAAWKAVWHPLGFMDIELFSDSSDILRLHIWSHIPGSYCSSGLSIHKHDWSMSSRVLCGSIENRIYELSEQEPPTHRVYEIEYRGTGNRLRATRHTVHCRLKESRTFHAGNAYTLPPGLFHEIVLPDGSITATLVRGIRHPGVRNEVLGSLDAGERYETERVPCEPGAVREAIDLVLASCPEAGTLNVGLRPDAVA